MTEIQSKRVVENQDIVTSLSFCHQVEHAYEKQKMKRISDEEKYILKLELSSFNYGQ